MCKPGKTYYSDDRITVRKHEWWIMPDLRLLRSLCDTARKAASLSQQRVKLCQSGKQRTSNSEPSPINSTELHNITQLRSLKHTWHSAISHIFNITDTDVKLICNYTAKSFNEIMTSRRTKYVNNPVLQFLACCTDTLL